MAKPRALALVGCLCCLLFVGCSSKSFTGKWTNGPVSIEFKDDIVTVKDGGGMSISKYEAVDSKTVKFTAGQQTYTGVANGDELAVSGSGFLAGKYKRGS